MTKAGSKKEGFVPAIVAFSALTIVAIALFLLVVGYKKLIGPAMLGFGFLPWIAVLIAGRTIKSIGADIVYGLVDGSILAIAAVAGEIKAGAIGAVLGGAAGNAISDGFGGLWEGYAANWLRKQGIEEARTPLSASMGKMSGVALGAAIVLTIAWTVIGV
jgi:hypothetical protein